MLPRAPFLALSMISLASLAACTQPRVPCTSAHGTFSVQYTLKKGDADSPCGGKTTEVLGLQSYFTVGPKEARAWTIEVGCTRPRRRA